MAVIEQFSWIINYNIDFGYYPSGPESSRAAPVQSPSFYTVLLVVPSVTSETTGYALIYSIEILR